eukprot:c16344_g1_i1.p1 GENE.c16344_g1_i1~~c16344_g1_i1.p1  ORF type:complete len:420 (-),score=126.78 c16344_g1_i1:29-1261(-)
MSDRRRRQIGDVLRVVVFYNNRKVAHIVDLYAISYCCWKTPDQWKKLNAWLIPAIRMKLMDQPSGAWAEAEKVIEQHLFIPEDVKKILKKKMTEEEKKQASAEANEAKELEVRRQKVKEEREKQMKAEAAAEVEREEAEIASKKRLESGKAEIHQNQLKQRENQQKIQLAKSIMEAAKSEQEAASVLVDSAKVKFETAASSRKAQAELAELERQQRAEDAQRVQLEMDQNGLEVAKNKASLELRRLVEKEQTPQNLEKAKKLIVEESADVNMVGGEFQDTALSHAAYVGFDKYFALMHAAVKKPDYNMRDRFGMSILTMVCKCTYTKGEDSMYLIVDQVARSNANPNTQDDQGNTAMHYMARWPQQYDSLFSKTIGLISKMTPKPDWSLKNRDGKSAMELLPSNRKSQVT